MAREAPGRTLEQLGELLDHLVLGGLAEATATRHHDGGLVELRTGRLLDVHGGDRGGAGGAELGHRRGHDRGGSAAAGLGREALRTERREVRAGAGERRW